MSNRMDITVTVNFHNGNEAEFDMATGVGGDAPEPEPLKGLGEAVEFGLAANGVGPEDWSSLVVVVGNPVAGKNPVRPKLSVVR